MTLKNILLALIPRWETTDWAMAYTRDGSNEVEPVKAMTYVRPGEVYAGIAKLSYFTWFEIAFACRYDVVMMRPWVNPHDKAGAA